MPKVSFSERHPTVENSSTELENAIRFDLTPTGSQQNAMKAEDSTPKPAEEPMDEFAELEAWLESGAYEVV